jgi:hypothetical protein
MLKAIIVNSDAICNVKSGIQLQNIELSQFVKIFE